jgi:hypothetical protein
LGWETYQTLGALDVAIGIALSTALAGYTAVPQNHGTAVAIDRVRVSMALSP